MRRGDAESLARWADSLEETIRHADAQLARPLRSPGLRCLCAGVQMVRLALIMRAGLQIAALGLSQVGTTARAGRMVEIISAGRVVYVAARTVGRAGRSFVRAGGRAGWAGWSAWSAARPPNPSSRIHRIHRAMMLGRAALFAWGGNRHDRR